MALNNGLPFKYRWLHYSEGAALYSGLGGSRAAEYSLGIAAMGTDIASRGNGIEAESILLMVILAAVFVLPFAFALRGFLKTRRLERIYHMYGQRRQLRMMQNRNSGPGMF